MAPGAEGSTRRAQDPEMDGAESQPPAPGFAQLPGPLRSGSRTQAPTSDSEKSHCESVVSRACKLWSCTLSLGPIP